MKGKWIQRVLLALIPVALLTTASLGLSMLNPPPPEPAATPVEEAAEEVVEQAPSVPTPAKPPVIAQTDPAPKPEQVVDTAQDATMTEIAQITEEPLPELVVDKTPLTMALADLDRAIQQAKLAVTALDANAQGRYIQETVNLLSGFSDAAFRALTPAATADTYRGVRPLLIEARVLREAAEVQWIAAVQRQLEARTKRLAELAQAGSANGSVPVATQPTVDLHAAVGPTGVLGTRGVRPEEQAVDVVSQAIKAATDALRLMPSQASAPSNAESQGVTGVSDQATGAMEWVVRRLETARKIVQIAIDR